MRKQAKKAQRNAARLRMQQVRLFLCKWDPLDVLGFGAPDDEYDCLIGGVLGVLSQNGTVSDLESFLHRAFRDHFGVEEIVGAERFAKKAVTWYRSVKSA